MATGSLTTALKETLALFETVVTPQTTSEVAEQLDIGRRSAYDRLERLVDQDVLDTKRVGASARVWWRPPASTDAHNGSGSNRELAKMGPETGTDSPDSRDTHEPHAAAATFEAHDQFQSLVTAVAEYAIFGVDTDGYIQTWNPGVKRIKGYTAEEIVGEHFSMFYTESDRHAGVPAANLAAAAEDGSVTDTGWRVRADSSQFWASVTITAIYNEADELTGYAKVTRDMTEHRLYEQQLQSQTERLARQRGELEHELNAFFENSPDMIDVLDPAGRLIEVNERLCRELGYTERELLGKGIWEYDVTIDRDGVCSLLSDLSVDEPRAFEAVYERADGSTFPVEVNLVRFNLIGQDRFLAISRDISERKQRERQLRNRIVQQEVVTELGKRALDDTDLDELMTDAVELVATTLETDYCKVLKLDWGTAELGLQAGVGWEDGIVGSATVSATADESQASYTLCTQEPVVVSDLETETRFSGPALLTDHNVRSGISTIIGPVTEPWGILGAHDTACREFSEHHTNFVQSVAHILAIAINRHQYEQQLIDQRERVEALNYLNGVIRDTTDAVIEQSTRQEIESTVCEHLAATDSYLLAWIGDVDSVSKQVQIRAEAGISGYTDSITISVDHGSGLSSGPTGRALQTGTTQVVNDIPTNSTHDPWREQVDTYGIRSSAAIPIIHEGTVYGVLNVYADRTNAFEYEERTVISQLGELIGHAIAANERKRALMSTEIIELEYHIQNISAVFETAVELSGTTSLTHTVPIADNKFLVYGTASADATEGLATLTEQIPHWEAITFQTEGDPISFELQLNNPPVLSGLASLGASLDEAVISDNEYRMTIHVSPSAEVRPVVDLVKSAYPQAEMLRRQQTTREHDDSRRIRQQLTEKLTDRQHTMLEIAYHAGFFEWPRGSSGKELATSAGVAPATFHQHLRKAEKQIFDELLSNASTPTE